MPNCPCSRGRYEVGIGPVSTPRAIFTTTESMLSFDQSTAAPLLADYAGESVWVRQVGTFEKSRALLLGALPIAP